MTIIEIESSNGFHNTENQSHRHSCWMDGYIEVPHHLEDVVRASGGYCDLTIEDGVLTGITPLPIPEPEPITPQLTTEEAIMDMLTDIDYRTSLLELGIGGAL